MFKIKKQLEETLKVLKDIQTPEAGIILGTGMSNLVEKIDIKGRIPYESIPHFVKPTVESHTGELIHGTLSGVPVVAFRGRFHFYEGYDMKEITYPVRVVKALGAKTLVVSNAAGGLNPLFASGDKMLITDHINFTGDSPLRGSNDSDLGVRFPDMSDAYTSRLRKIAEKVSLDLKIPLKQGVYLGLMGPNLETPAEYRFIRRIGADAVGMSTVPEVIVAVHAGLSVLGFSVITDMCLPDALEATSLDKILAVAATADGSLSELITRIFAHKELD